MLTLFSDFKEILGKEEHDIGVSLQVYNEGSLGGKSDPRRFILTGFDGDTDCKKISVFIGSCSKTTEYTWETLDDDDRIVVTFKQDIGGFGSLVICYRHSLQCFVLCFWDACLFSFVLSPKNII